MFQCYVVDVVKWINVMMDFIVFDVYCRFIYSIVFKDNFCFWFFIFQGFIYFIQSIVFEMFLLEYFNIYGFVYEFYFFCYFV